MLIVQKATADYLGIAINDRLTRAAYGANLSSKDTTYFITQGEQIMNILLTLLLGCPQPPAATTSMQNQSGGQNGQNQNQQGDPNAGGQNGQNQNQRRSNAGGQNNQVQPSKGPPVGGKMDAPDQDQFGYLKLDGEIIQDAIVIKINNSGNGDPPPQKHTRTS